jgi:hypothetical protein
MLIRHESRCLVTIQIFELTKFVCFHYHYTGLRKHVFVQ